MAKITKENIETVVVDAGLVVLNEGTAEERVLGPCRGENSFEVTNEIRQIEMNNIRSKVKGARRVINREATITANVMDLSIENLKLALPGAKVTGNTLTNGARIELTEYIDSVTLIGETQGGEVTKFTVYNALCDESLSIVMNDKDEAVVQFKFSAHIDPDDADEKLYKIEKGVI